MKKIIAFAIGAVLSFNVFAGYVQYNFSGGGVTGFMIQHDDDKSIAAYYINTPMGGYAPYFGYLNGNITSAATNPDISGPTNIYIYSHFLESSLDRAIVNFGAENVNNPGQYSFDISVKSGPAPYEYSPYPIPTRNFAYSGIVVESTVDASYQDYLNEQGGYDPQINRIIPGSFLYTVPEPSSIFLLLLAAGGFAIARRRKQ